MQDQPQPCAVRLLHRMTQRSGGGHRLPHHSRCTTIFTIGMRPYLLS